MESTFHVVTVMGLDTRKIRHEIRRILKNGPTRSKDLADKVIKKVGSEKTVYREIQAMCISGEIKKNENNRANITYELVKLSEEVEVSLNNMDKQLDQMSEYLKKSSEMLDSRKDFPIFLLVKMVTAIKELQKFQARMKILSYFPAMKKTKQFKKINLKSEKLWDEIFRISPDQIDDNLIKELMINFPYVQRIIPRVLK